MKKLLFVEGVYLFQCVRVFFLPGKQKAVVSVVRWRFLVALTRIVRKKLNIEVFF